MGWSSKYEVTAVSDCDAFIRYDFGKNTVIRRQAAGIHGTKVDCASISSKGTWARASSRDGNTFLQSWKRGARTKDEANMLDGLTFPKEKRVTAVAFASKRGLLSVGTSTGNIAFVSVVDDGDDEESKILDIVDEELGKPEVISLAWSPDSKWICALIRRHGNATAANDQTEKGETRQPQAVHLCIWKVGEDVGGDVREKGPWRTQQIVNADKMDMTTAKVAWPNTDCLVLAGKRRVFIWSLINELESSPSMPDPIDWKLIPEVLTSVTANRIVPLPENETPLVLAARLGHVDCIKLLLAAGAVSNVSVEDPRGNPFGLTEKAKEGKDMHGDPLIYAIEGKARGSAKVRAVKALLAAHVPSILRKWDMVRFYDEREDKFMLGRVEKEELDTKGQGRCEISDRHVDKGTPKDEYKALKRLAGGIQSIERKMIRKLETPLDLKFFHSEESGDVKEEIKDLLKQHGVKGYTRLHLAVERICKNGHSTNYQTQALKLSAPTSNGRFCSAWEVQELLDHGAFVDSKLTTGAGDVKQTNGNPNKESNLNKWRSGNKADICPMGDTAFRLAKRARKDLFRDERLANITEREREDEEMSSSSDDKRLRKWRQDELGLIIQVRRSIGAVPRSCPHTRLQLFCALFCARSPPYALLSSFPALLPSFSALSPSCPALLPSFPALLPYFPFPCSLFHAPFSREPPSLRFNRA